MAVDELIEALISRLDNYGILDDTYIFYSTDNGYHIGQHRLQPSKQCAYQEDVNIPLIVRGPGVAANRKTDIVTTHTDLAPTFLNLAGVPLPGVPPLQDFDGSVIPVQASELDHIEQSGAFGEHINVEQWGNIVPEGEYERRYYWNHTYKALRVMGDGGSYHFLYTVWCSGAHELYDLSVSFRFSRVLCGPFVLFYHRYYRAPQFPAYLLKLYYSKREIHVTNQEKADD